MNEHRWADALTHVVARTPETDAAVDSDQERADHHREVSDDLQAVITRVGAAHTGDTRDVILANLQRELEASGHWPQPRSWLESVAAEMAVGHHYRCGTV